MHAFEDNGSPHEGVRYPEFTFFTDETFVTRSIVYTMQYLELRERLCVDPVPMPEEWQAGIYIEELEPPVREAVFGLNEMGYDTHSSGFGFLPIQSDDLTQGFLYTQYIEFIGGVPDISTDVISEAAGVEVYLDTTPTKRLHELRFMPDDPIDLDAIHDTWQRIVDVVPDLGSSAERTPNALRLAFDTLIGQEMYDEYLTLWAKHKMALYPMWKTYLKQTLLAEGRDFGEGFDRQLQAAEDIFAEFSAPFHDSTGS